MATRSETSFTAFVPTNGRLWLQIGVIVAAVLFIYSPVFHGGWLWDDNVDITDNLITQSPTGLWTIWFEPGSQVDYYPIKASVQWVQWHLWGMDTLGYHLTNIFLHFLNALLVWRLFGKFKLKFAWLGGLLFAIHPANVESVAWIAELKNTLSLTPFLLAMIAWIDYDNAGKRRDYFLSLAFFLIAMLCKTSMVMFPVIILLHAWWKRGRIDWRDLRVGAPFFIISLMLGGLTAWLQNTHAIRANDFGEVGLLSRMAVGGLAGAFYFAHGLWPVGLVPIYAKWAVDPPTPSQFLPWLIVGAMAWVGWAKRATWGRHALLGLGFFALMLSPFLGFKMISFMRYTWVADHFLYLPMIGLIGLVVAGSGWLEAQLSEALRRWGLALIVTLVILLTRESHGYAAVYADPETFCTYTLRYNPGAWPAHNNLGNVFLHKGQVEEAIAQYQDTLGINPHFADAHYNLGAALAHEGRLDEAVAQYQQALEINPDSADTHNNLGIALAQMGRVADAIEQYQLALALNPNSAEAHDNLGIAFVQKGRMDEAMAEFQKAAKLNPNDAEAQKNLAKAQAMVRQAHGSQ